MGMSENGSLTLIFDASKPAVRRRRIFGWLTEMVFAVIRVRRSPVQDQVEIQRPVILMVDDDEKLLKLCREPLAESI